MITGPVGRLGSAAQNALEVARFGGLETDEEPSPFDVFSEQRIYKLRRYFPDDDATGRPPVILVPPMMLSAEVFDVAPAVSGVAVLHEHGVDPWVVDFGAPEREEGGLERTLTDHVLACSDAVDRVREATGADVHLGGYSQGGMFCYQTAAYKRNEGIASVIPFGAPVDVSSSAPFGIPEEMASRMAEVLGGVLGRGALPAWASRIGFRMMDPVKSFRQRIAFLRQLHDRDALLPRERQRRFLEAEGWVAWPGPALAEFMRQFVAHNRMLSGGFVIEGRLVTLADIESPVLVVVGEVDEIAKAPSVRAIARAAPRADVYEVTMRAGHFGLVVGSTSARITWPTVAAWALWRDGKGEMPEGVHRLEEGEDPEHDPGVGERLGYGVGLTAQVGAGIARSVLGTASRTVRTVRELSSEAAEQLPKLARLGQISARTQISLGLLLDEQARKAPGEVLFLFEDRAHTREAAKGRIDAVVRGLISVGVHQGDHVGVLMDTRPSALAVIAALNRLGAVAVLIRPDGDLEREARLGEVERVIADPEHAEAAAGLGTVHTFVLGGGGGQRDLGDLPVSDMEQIDPDAVALPAWYQPNPGKASDLAFIVFTGEGERTRASRITNRRWALSAFGTATSAGLTNSDTVYSVTPIHHPSALLMSIGGALAGGARLAMASSFDPSTFWDEARRYGVTVASYTWTLLHDLVEAPPHPGERHHSVRLFIGSGMPRGLWRRVERRFRPARVLEFYASTEGDAILVNLSGEKPGAMGRPLPGSADVRIIRWEIERGHPIEGDDGLAQECPLDEAGMLIARVAEGVQITATPLRGVFEPGDTWVATGDLFRRDADGDFWLVDPVPALIRTADGLVPSRPIADLLGDLHEVDLAVSYGVPTGEDSLEVSVAAVTLRDGEQLDADEIDEALAELPPEQRPEVVRVVDEIPVTTWYRPISGPLRAEGIPSGNGQVFRRDEAGGYRPPAVEQELGAAAS